MLDADVVRLLGRLKLRASLRFENSLPVDVLGGIQRDSIGRPFYFTELSEVLPGLLVLHSVVSEDWIIVVVEFHVVDDSVVLRPSHLDVLVYEAVVPGLHACACSCGVIQFF